MDRKIPAYVTTCLMTVVLVLFLSGCSTHQQSETNYADLPLPGSLPLRDYERILYTWLLEQKYKSLDWRHDKMVRDTGPYIRNEYFGTHPAVRIFYSPEVITWLEHGRKGDIPDGAMIIKEMYSPPAVLYQELEKDPKYQQDPAAYEAMLGKLVSDWTVMVRDKAGSKDGWFWGGPGAAKENESIKKAVERQLDDYSHALYSSFGAPCLRCHASASNELTFSTLKNITGFDSDEYPLRFMVDNSWRSADHLDSYPLSLLKNDDYAQSLFNIPALLRPWSGEEQQSSSTTNLSHMGILETETEPAQEEALAEPDPAFVKQFPELLAGIHRKVKGFPSQWADHVVPGPGKPEAFMTSSNCLGCHGGLGGLPYGVSMFLQTGPNYGDGFNISEYGEWRWSPMGLAGRDPIFHTQLESEMKYIQQNGKQIPTPLKASVEATQQAVTNTCLSCHGAMGQRQLETDAAKDPTLDANFNVDYFYLTTALSADTPRPADYRYHKYGELAREGISCAVCHHIDQPAKADVSGWNPTEPGWLTPETPKQLAYGLFHNSTGQFVDGPNDEFFGPFTDISQLPMQHVLGVKPVFNEFTSNSQMCGTCHTINLPNIGQQEHPFPVLDSAESNPAYQQYAHTIEQATFLEWQNSTFAQNQGQPGSEFASCQDCHMPNDFQSADGSIDIDHIVSQIATIQDANYPAAEETLPLNDIQVPLRPDYKRHEHVGLNVFLLEMFDQFPEILGVAKTDYMTSANNGVDLAIDNMIRQAQQDTVDVAVDIEDISNNQITARVTVTNKTGHRFPSGVAFRRAFIELLVMDDDKVIWGSGRTNKVGVIVDGQGKPLATEFLPDPSSYQPHYQKITREDQVQIYEELNQDAQQQFTTSFVHRVSSPKDNRLLPKGWRDSSVFASQGEVMRQFMAATDPHGAGQDPDYADQGPGFPGRDSLVYQIDLPPGTNMDQLKVKATLYYQSIPPYWLKQRFTAAPDGIATQRLYYLVSRLNLAGTAMANWKLQLTGAQVLVR